MSEPQPMPSARPELHVLDVPDLERFEARLGEARELAGIIDYRLNQDFIVLTHTEVLPGFEGQGIGSRLARAVLEDLRERQIAVIPKCAVTGLSPESGVRATAWCPSAGARAQGSPPHRSTAGLPWAHRWPS